MKQPPSPLWLATGVLFLWALFMFLPWYKLTYTKMWELRQLIGKDRWQQLRVMHPAPMGRLIELREWILAQPDWQNYRVVVRDDLKGQLPLVSNPPIERAVLDPIPVVSWEQRPDFTADLHYVMVWPATGAAEFKPDDQLSVPIKIWSIQP
jgi:hypothetical protein